MSIGETVVNRNLDPLDGARFRGVSPGDTYWNLDRGLPSRSRLTTRYGCRRTCVADATHGGAAT
jgi:hypothetical protein